jgi:peptidoglycan/LPS O-acetylase OafA/YrhL
MTVSDAHNSGQRVKYLDGMRGLAILLVAAGHIFYRYSVFQFGWIGLNLFFVLSGYLITQRLYVHLSGNTRSYFKNFYWRRILRIFPLYYGCLVIFFLLLPLIYPGYDNVFGSLYSMQGWFWSYSSNWMMILHGMPKQPVFFHFWSLAVEEQFYVVWPFLFLLLVKARKISWIIVLMIIGSIFLRNSIHDGFSSYLNTGTAAEPLLLGALITILEKQKVLEKNYNCFLFLALASVISLVIIFINDPSPHITNDWLLRAGYTSIDLIWAWILVLCIVTTKMSAPAKQVLSAGWLKWLGKYSYGIYVFHWLVLNLFIYKAVTEMINRGIDQQLAYFSVRVAGIALILLVSYLSYNFYEKKFLALKKYFI